MAEGLRARQLLVVTDELISTVKDAETGQRGYLLTGSDEYLAPYSTALAMIPHLLDRLAEAAGRADACRRSETDARPRGR